ncbi:YheT family hydrolase [Wenzhouxiangella limi]|uniref:Alpha/beta fold hydrolase n=1 Tax=Wenzhouxiangella limi TaxID=2707351 RepID=A0A845V0G2_9GAMM|nr:alpha/beta fold hydrolase [Wenzhouxiangella limi]NDY96032.1 alpha/beta fold hydrolase [Wenzhouxiangella limi]
MKPDAAPYAGWPAFAPKGWLANPHVQSLMTSGPWRKRAVRRQAREFLSRSEPEVIRASDGTRLLGYRNRPRQGEVMRRDALVILLHGWEGSVDSNYMLASAVALDAAGFDTFRLNFRDHGESHHLNEGLFHSCLLTEVVDAVGQLRQNYGDRPVFLAGFSLGGNFALRVARNAPEHGFELNRAVAVSPVIRPRHVLDALEEGLAVYHYYFVYKWRRSLRIKQALYPEKYRLEEWFRIRDLREQTRWLVENLTRFPDLDSYLEGYSIAGDYLVGLQTPSLLVSAIDDPIIPVSDIQALPDIPALDVELLERGGHCGFIETWSMESWIEKRLIGELCQHLKT